MKKILFFALVLVASMAASAQVSSVQICDSVAWNDDITQILNEAWEFRTVPFSVIQEGDFVQIRGEVYFTDSQGNYLDIDWDDTNTGWFNWDWASFGDGWEDWGTTSNAWYLKLKRVSEPAPYTFDRGAYYVWWDAQAGGLYVIWLWKLHFDEPAPEPDPTTVVLHGNVAEITDLAKAMDDKAFTVGDVSNASLREGVFVQLLGDYWFSDAYGNPIYPSFQSTDYYDWSTWGNGELAGYNVGMYAGERYTYKLLSVLDEKKFTPENPKAVYFKYDAATNTLEETTLNKTLTPVADPSRPSMHGELALITDLSRAMDNCFTIGDISYEQLCEGVFVQVRGTYWYADDNGLPLMTGWGGSESYDWATWGNGELSKYYCQPAYNHTIRAATSKVTYGGGTPKAVYFKYDPATKVLREITLRDYLGQYDWHDFSLQGYVRTIEGTDPITGYYDYATAFATDSLASYYYNSDKPSEFADVPLFFSENPYQVDGPCRLMYKGEPWALKLDSVEVLDENNAAIRYCEPGTEWVWWYHTAVEGEIGDTINLQAGVYIFFLNYYDQENEPLSLSVMRCDLGKFTEGDEGMMPAEPYEMESDPAPNIEQENGTVLTYYYTYTYKEAKYKYKNFLTPYGDTRYKYKYYVYHERTSATSKAYPISGLGALLGYPDYIGIIYSGFNQGSAKNQTNYATLSYEGKQMKVSASKGNGIPVVLYNPTSDILKVVYISDAQYNAIKTSVDAFIADEGNAATFDLSGRRIATPHTGIVLRHGQKVLVR